MFVPELTEGRQAAEETERALRGERCGRAIGGDGQRVLLVPVLKSLLGLCRDGVQGGTLLDCDGELRERLGGTEALRVGGAATDNETAEAVLLEELRGAGHSVMEVVGGPTRDGDLEVLGQLQGAAAGLEAARLGPESGDGRVDGREEGNESEELHGGSQEERKGKESLSGVKTKKIRRVFGEVDMSGIHIYIILSGHGSLCTWRMQCRIWTIDVALTSRD